MVITLNKVMPVPLADTPLSPGSCWGKEEVIDTTKFYLAEAPSGTGKTTLVNLIYGIRKDYTGDIFFERENARNFSIDQWTSFRREKIAVVFQDLRLFPQLTAMENIRVKNGLTNRLNETEISIMADQLGILPHLNRLCGKMSLGQQQRVAIIRALAQPFDFLLLDEPFSHLDENNTLKATAMIMDACAKNNAGLLLTSLGSTNVFSFEGKIII